MTQADGSFDQHLVVEFDCSGCWTKGVDALLNGEYVDYPDMEKTFYDKMMECGASLKKKAPGDWVAVVVTQEAGKEDVEKEEDDLTAGEMRKLLGYSNFGYDYKSQWGGALEIRGRGKPTGGAAAGAVKRHADRVPSEGGARKKARLEAAFVDAASSAPATMSH